MRMERRAYALLVLLFATSLSGAPALGNKKTPASEEHAGASDLGRVSSTQAAVIKRLKLLRANEGLGASSSTGDNLAATAAQSNQFPPEVTQAVLALKQALTKAGAQVTVKETPGKLVLEEHGFDIFEHFVAQTFLDKEIRPPVVKTVTLEWKGADGIFKIIGPTQSEEYSVENTSAYAPFYFVRNQNDGRLVSREDISCFSRECHGLPLDIGDGWGLFDKYNIGVVIKKIGDPREAALWLGDRPIDLNDEWVMPTSTRVGRIILPKDKPLAALKAQGDVYTVQVNGNKRMLKSESERKITEEFLGRPADFKKSFLLNTGHGYVLVSKKDLFKTSNALTKLPVFDESHDYVTVEEGRHKRVVLLDDPSVMSSHFDDVVEKMKGVWVVSRSKDKGNPMDYFVFDPDDPAQSLGPFAVPPKQLADGILVAQRNHETIRISRDDQTGRLMAVPSAGKGADSQ